MFAARSACAACAACSPRAAYSASAADLKGLSPRGEGIAAITPRHVLFIITRGGVLATYNQTIMDKKWTLPIDEATSSVPSHWALTFSDAVALYAQELWAIELNLPGAPDPVWNKAVIDAATCLEVRHLVREFARAFRNQRQLSFEQYFTSTSHSA